MRKIRDKAVKGRCLLRVYTKCRSCIERLVIGDPSIILSHIYEQEGKYLNLPYDGYPQVLIPMDNVDFIDVQQTQL